MKPVKIIRYFSIIVVSYYNSLLIYNYIFNYPAAFKFSYFNIINHNDCCGQYLNYEGEEPFKCNVIDQNNYLT